MGEEKDRDEDRPAEDNPKRSPETEVAERDEVTHLTNLVAEKVEELLGISRRLDDLNRIVSGKDEEISALKQSIAETEEKLASTSNSLNEAVTGYRRAVTEANPDIVEDLITGDSLESINQSLEQAKIVVNKVKQGLESQISQARIPAGAPERTAPDLSGLSPREKIHYAVSKQ